MDVGKWHELWVTTVIANGFTKPQAYHIFYARYSEAGVDLTKDPVAEASKVTLPCTVE